MKYPNIEINRNLILLAIATHTFLSVFLYFGFLYWDWDFIVKADMAIPAFADYFARLAMFWLNIYFIVGYTTNMHGVKLVKCVLPYGIIHAILMLIFPEGNLMLSTVIPIAFTTYVAIRRRVVLNGIMIWLAIFLYQIVWIPLTTGSLSILEYNQQDIYTFWFFALNFNIFLGLLYLYKGGLKHYVRQAIWYRTLVVEAFANSAGDSEDSSAWAKAHEMPKGIFWAVIALLAVLQAIQFAAIASSGAIGGVFSEVLVIAIAFAVFGLIVKRKWHAHFNGFWKTFIACTITTSAIMVFTARALPPLRYSLIMPVLAALVWVYLFYRIEYDRHRQQRKLEALKKAVLKFAIKKFDVDMATPEQISKRCLGLGKDNRYTDMCIDFFCSGKTNAQLAKEYHYELSTISEYKRRMRRELNEK